MKKIFYKYASWIFALQGTALVVLQYVLLSRIHIRLLIGHWFYLFIIGLLQIFGGIVLGRALRLLYIRANTDFLTGLYTREVFYKHLNAETDGTMSLLLLDLDDFKSVNDNYGHLAGDRALAAVAELLQSEVRQKDIVARIGGEEFAIILKGVSILDAHKIGERIKNRVEETEFPYQGKHLSVSVGISNMDTCKTTRELFQLADDALYRAKEKRNCVELMEFI